MNVYEQSKIFCMFFIIGLFIGIIFDIFRGSRKVFKFSDIFVIIQDIVFLFISGLLFFRSIIVFNNGEIRFYVFLATFFGIIIYSLTLSNICVIIISVIFKIIKRLFEIIWKILKLPYHFITSFFKNRNKSLNLKK